jgi:general stress protein 26
VGVLPRPVEEVLERALVSEFTVIDDRGRPISHPMIPLYDGQKVLLHSSILFSKKLRHIRSNPRVAVAVTDLSATHGEPLLRRILVQGDATLHEDDPHTTWERILPLWIAKEPVVKAFYAKRVALPMFWERSLIEITPRRAMWWEGGDTSRPPEVAELTGVA